VCTRQFLPDDGWSERTRAAFVHCAHTCHLLTLMPRTQLAEFSPDCGAVDTVLHMLQCILPAEAEQVIFCAYLAKCTIGAGEQRW
jgi:hypothetical protein